ncbi:MAG: ABC transporter transmembrane domain-containing protein, partial [Hyphomicrobium sp.]
MKSPKQAPGKSASGTLALDEQQRGLLNRFMRDWVYPRWRELVVAMILTGLLAAVTGAYPMIIKASFDMLMKDQSGMLPYVLAAIIGATTLRSLLLYAQTVETSRIVMRLTTDMQRVAFSHLITADFARLSRDTPGRLVSKLTNDIGFVQTAATAALNTAVRDTLTIVALVASMIYLDWVMSVIVLCVYPIAALPVAMLSKKLRRVAKQTQNELGGMTSLLTEKLSAARLIKSF